MSCPRGKLDPGRMWTLVAETADSCRTGADTVKGQSMVYGGYPEDSCHDISNKGYANSLASSYCNKSPQRQTREDMARFDAWGQSIS